MARYQYRQLFTPVGPAGPEAVTADRWMQPPSQPLRQLPSFVRQLPAFAWSGFTPPFVPETVTLDKWYQPASQPTRRKPPPAPATTLAWSGFTPLVVPLPPLPLLVRDLPPAPRPFLAALVSTGIFVPVVSSVTIQSGSAIVTWLD